MTHPNQSERFVRIGHDNATKKQVELVAEIVRRGGVILYPTDTIYGLGCDVLNRDAVRRIMQIKGRPEGKPLIVLASDLKMVRALIDDFPPSVSGLIDQFWPGALTIVFKASKLVSPEVTAGTNTVAIRVPGNRFCRELVRSAGTPIVSTSANRSGTVPHRLVELLRGEFGDEVDCCVDGGDLEEVQPSSIIDATTAPPRLIREGVINRNALTAFLPELA